MQVYSEYRFKKAQFKIPNISKFPDFNITVTREGKAGNNHVTVTWRGAPLLVLKHESVYDTLEEMYKDDSLCIKSGLFLTNPLCWLAVIDALYYHCNPVDLDLEHKSSIQVSEIIYKLQVRLDKALVASGSAITTNLINQAIKFLERTYSISRPDETSTIEAIKLYLENINSVSLYRSLFWRTSFDLSKNIWMDNRATIAVELRLGTFKVVNTVNRINFMHARFGYLKTLEGPNYYYNPETEVYYAGSIYLKTDVELSECPECGTTCPRFSLRGGICSMCAETLGKIHSYSTKAPSLLKFKATKVTPNTLYLGAELEFESKDGTSRVSDAVYTNRALKDHAILKTDGSIQRGFEIVTCPATLDIHLVEFKKFFEELKTKTKLHKDSNTGMHVHISRKPLSMLTVGKMTAFLNNTNNKAFITGIAGRELNHYCSQDVSRTVSYPLTHGSGARYNALNLSNVDTVELRIFSTPETFEEFAYKMEFAEALAIYCSPCTVNMSVYELLNYLNFKDWAIENRHSYPHLATKLKSL